MFRIFYLQFRIKGLLFSANELTMPDSIKEHNYYIFHRLWTVLWTVEEVGSSVVQVLVELGK
jgi:hypothetical protein